MRYRLGEVVVEMTETWVHTILPDGREVHGIAETTEEYRARARALGYGEDVDALNREHELTHSLLAHWLGLPCSPVMRTVADQRDGDPVTWDEEAAVLAIQKFAKTLGIDLTKLPHGC